MLTTNNQIILVLMQTSFRDSIIENPETDQIIQEHQVNSKEINKELHCGRERNSVRQYRIFS